MSDIQVIKPPKYIVYDGNLYELKEANVVHVLDYEEAINIAKLEQKGE